MKRTQIIVASLLALAVAGISTLYSAEEGVKEGKATVRTIHGRVDYSTDNATWLPVRVNMKFAPGVILRTGANGEADISVNGTSSAIRMTNNTTLKIPVMTYSGSASEGDRQTMLNLETGAIFGNVKKISQNSRYEIETPHGVAGVRGTDVHVEVIPLPDGSVTVTFDSVTGVITVSAVINGQTVVRTLTTGMSWTIGQEPRRIPQELLEVLQDIIQDLIHIVFPPPIGPGPGHHGPNPIPPFPGGTGPPQGGGSS